jgi:hypothetical protein
MTASVRVGRGKCLRCTRPVADSPKGETAAMGSVWEEMRYGIMLSDHPAGEIDRDAYSDRGVFQRDAC